LLALFEEAEEEAYCTSRETLIVALANSWTLNAASIRAHTPIVIGLHANLNRLET